MLIPQSCISSQTPLSVKVIMMKMRGREQWVRSQRIADGYRSRVRYSHQDFSHVCIHYNSFVLDRAVGTGYLIDISYRQHPSPLSPSLGPCHWRPLVQGVVMFGRHHSARPSCFLHLQVPRALRLNHHLIPILVSEPVFLAWLYPLCPSSFLLYERSLIPHAHHNNFD